MLYYISSIICHSCYGDLNSDSFLFVFLIVVCCVIYCIWKWLPTFVFQTQANTRKWLVEQSLKVPEVQQLEPQVCDVDISCYQNVCPAVCLSFRHTCGSHLNGSRY